MEIRKTFVVKAKPDTVWMYFTDPSWIAACLPGADITGRVDERTFNGGITVKVGPVTTTYRGKMTFQRLDKGTHTAEIVASGQDIRGKGGADLRITSKLTEHVPGETEVTVVSEVTVSGILAQMGRGMIQEVSDHLFREFTAAMAASLKVADPTHRTAAAAPASEPIQAIPFGKLVRHPGVWGTLLVVAAVVWWLWLR
jgi:uncharacterized protein